MSRAFVKEDDSELPGDDLPERPQSPHPNYVTAHGLKALQRRVEKLQEERRALTESGEPEMLDKEHLKLVERDLRYWQERLDKAIQIDPATLPHDKIESAPRSKASTTTRSSGASPLLARTRPSPRPARSAGSRPWRAP